MQLPDVSCMFDLADKHDMLKYLTRPDLSSSTSYCDELSTDCHDGFYQSSRCRQHPDDCAVLLSSYPGNYVHLSSLVVNAGILLIFNCVVLDNLIAWW